MVKPRTMLLPRSISEVKAAFKFAEVANVVALSATTPIFTAPLAYFWINETVNWRWWFTLVSICIGCLMIVQPPELFGGTSKEKDAYEYKQFGYICAVGTAIFCSIWSVHVRVRELNDKSFDSTVYMMWSRIILFLQSIIFCYFTSFTIDLDLYAIKWACISGMVYGCGANLLVANVGQVPANYASIIYNLEIPFSYLLQATILQVFGNIITGIGLSLTFIVTCWYAVNKPKSNG